MNTKSYKHEIQSFNPETGEITFDSKYSVTAINNEDDYIKVYRYLNTVFAFKGINQSYIPILMEISNYMSYANKGQEVILTKYFKDKIADAVGVSTKRVNDVITGLKKADVLRPVPGSRGVYAVNPFIIGRGKWSDIKELRSQFDYNSGLMTTQSIVTDKIDGTTIAMITEEAKKDRKQIPGQMSLDLKNGEE